MAFMPDTGLQWKSGQQVRVRRPRKIDTLIERYRRCKDFGWSELKRLVRMVIRVMAISLMNNDI